jgi:hypothetical protein
MGACRDPVGVRVDTKVALGCWRVLHMTVSDEHRDVLYEVFGTAYVPPTWLARAPTLMRALLTLVTLPGIVLVLVMYLLTPTFWLTNVLTRHRYNSTWGVRVVRVARTPILVVGFPWLLCLLSSTLALAMFVWMLVYLVLRQFNGAADQERRLLKSMEEMDRLERRMTAD